MRPHDLLHTYLSLIPVSFFFHQVVRKPLKFINNVLQTNESFLNELGFPSFLSLYAFIPGHCLGKCHEQFLYKYQNQSILLLSVIWLGMTRLIYNSFETDMGSRMM